MYVKSNQSIILHTGRFDWTNMTSRTSSNLYDSGATSNIKLNSLRTVIGNNTYDYSDSTFEVNKIQLLPIV
jgi:hypothetical protein